MKGGTGMRRKKVERALDGALLQTLADRRGRMPRSALSIGVGVSSSVSSGRFVLSFPISCALTLFRRRVRTHPSLFTVSLGRMLFRPLSQPPTAVTGVGLAPNSYKIDERERHIGVARGFLPIHLPTGLSLR